MISNIQDLIKLVLDPIIKIAIKFPRVLNIILTLMDVLIFIKTNQKICFKKTYYILI